MNEFSRALNSVGHGVLLFWASFLELKALPRQMKRVIEQAFLIGCKTVPIVAVLSFFIGGVLALQSGFSLSRISGGQTFLGSIVGLSMCKELAPVMTAFLVAGRVGSAIAAELASMKVYQEIDALKTMNISPIRILVMPRLMAIVLTMPVLTMFSILIGWYGGMIVSEYIHFINLDPSIYVRSLKEFVKFKDVFQGLVKAEVFGVIVVLIACSQGLKTHGGPREIGFSVTRSVVSSMIIILILDYFITRIQI
jgi:phospholipid/cholesterol/gamma-HCH transport system permease protein